LIVRGKNFDQGFDEFEDGNIPGAVQRGFCSTDRIATDVLGWLERNAGTRFFLYLHLVDTHWPYKFVPRAWPLLGGSEPPGFPRRGFMHYQRLLVDECESRGNGAPDVESLIPAEHQDWIRRSYDAAVASADAYVGAVLDKLEELGIQDRTVVVFTSDHGEELLDHGMLGHGFALYEEHVRVPLLLAGPGIPAGRRVDQPVSNRHVAPTLARLAGGEMTAVTMPIDLAKAAFAEHPVFVSTEHGIWNGRHPLATYGVRDGTHVFLHAPLSGATEASCGTDQAHDLDQLFDLAADPAQHVDLSDAQPGIARTLGATLGEHVESAKRARSSRALPADESTVRMLEDLGYVDGLASKRADEE
jgi:arylsulfatase A-like enzyme